MEKKEQGGISQRDTSEWEVLEHYSLPPGDEGKGSVAGSK